MWTDGEQYKPCQHAFCVSCVQQYFSDGQHHCPVCGIDDDKSAGAPATATQPADGVMMVTYDNAFRLPGYETASRGTIIVCYSFPPGVQKATKSRSILYLFCPFHPTAARSLPSTQMTEANFRTFQHHKSQKIINSIVYVLLKIWILICLCPS